MFQFRRLIIALAIFLSGVVLTPYVTLPAEAISWHLFADAYDTQARLTINHDIGRPGSIFEIKGENFPFNDLATITVNGLNLGFVPTDNAGKLEFELDTTGAEDGAYFVTATVNSTSATVRFVLDSGAPDIWPSEGTTPVFRLPAGVAFIEFIYLPIIFR